MNILAARSGTKAQQAIAGILLWCLCLATYTIYAPGLDAPWTFDDAPNLQGLSQVADLPSALAFITSGIASSLGRPLSLLSFIPNASSWPDDPASFRHFNVLLHILNGMLVAWLSLKVGRLQPKLATHPIWPALALCALWLLHPLLASTSLFVVQRMTLLAATVTLGALIAFVHGRELLSNKPRAAYVWMSCALVLGAGLGILAKENAALLPFFAATLSFTVLSHLPYGNRTAWRIWKSTFFIGPALLLSVYTCVHWNSLLLSYAARPFSLEERLLTQPVILWDYIRQIVAPNISRMGLYHDDVTIYSSATFPVVMSIASLLIVFLASMGFKKHMPWLAFAFLWYISGHLLESTVFNLEMYYEHRNYLPSLGPLAAIIALIWRSRIPWPRYVFMLTVPVFALLLWQVTSLWGTPLLAAERWASAHPKSSRAVQFLAQRYVLQNEHNKALQVIKKGSLANPNASDLALQALQLSCGIVTEEEIQNILQDLINRAPDLYPSLAIVNTFTSIRFLLEKGDCPGLNNDNLIVLIHAYLANPMIHNYGLIRHHLHHQLAQIYINEGYLDGAVKNLQAAFNAKPNAETAKLLAVTLASAGLYENAIESLDRSLSKAPPFSLKRKSWEDSFQPLRDLLVKKVQ